MSKLLIIGNGFDLTCGLRSSYKDFFLWQHNNSNAFATYYMKETGDHSYAKKESGGTIFTYPSSIESKAFTEELTVWDMYFISLKRCYKYWCDIEKAISDSLLGQDSFWKKTLRNIYAVIRKYNSGSNLENNLSVFERLIWRNIFDKNITLPESSFGVHKTQLEFKEEEFYTLLLDQLELFENKFRKYISQQVEAHADYSSNTLTLTKELLSFKNNETATYSVMNFNYTDPFIWFDENAGVKFIRDNVHGTITSDYSIFGIDSEVKNIDSSLQQIHHLDPAYLFTKQRRRIVKMAEGKESPRVTNNQYSELVFYGHSLNEQDYSYFHTLFDLCDLYGSELKLLFYYKEYGETAGNNKRIRETRITEVSALLGRYGETFSNKSHGRKLIDKLFNERRLIFKSISR